MWPRGSMKSLQLVCWGGGGVGNIFPVILRIRVFCNKHVGNVGPASPTLYMACVKTSMPPALQTDVSLQARARFSTKQAGSSHWAPCFRQPHRKLQQRQSSWNKPDSMPDPPQHSSSTPGAPGNAWGHFGWCQLGEGLLLVSGRSRPGVLQRTPPLPPRKVTQPRRRNSTADQSLPILPVSVQ